MPLPNTAPLIEHTYTQTYKYIHICKHRYTKTPPPQYRLFIHQQGFLLYQPQFPRQQDLGPTQLGLTISILDGGHPTVRAKSQYLHPLVTTMCPWLFQLSKSTVQMQPGSPSTDNHEQMSQRSFNEPLHTGLPIFGKHHHGASLTCS